MIVRMLTKALYFKEVIGMLSFYILFAAQPLSPDIEINFEKSDYFVSGFSDEINDDKNSILTLILANKSKSPITDMEVELRGVVEIHSIGGRSSSFRVNEEISKYIEFEKKDNFKIYFKNAENIPAGHNIQIQMVGKFLDLIIEDRVHVTSSAKSQSITEMSKITGIWVFVYSQSTTVFAVLSSLLILLGLKRLYEEEVVK